MIRDDFSFKILKIINRAFPDLDFKFKDYQRFDFKDPKVIAAHLLLHQNLPFMGVEVNNPIQNVKIVFSDSDYNLKEGLVITTKKLYKLYGDILSKNILILPDGEKIKDKKHLFKVYDFLFEKNATKKSEIKVFGGGSLTDLVSFACSTFKRGVPFELYPTTFLAQVDAAIGGKNAINYNGVKNIIGCVNIPDKTYINPLLLLSLPSKEYFNGLVEALKISIITGKNLDLFVNHMYLLKNKNMSLLKNLIYNCASSKLKIVSRDLYDTKIRHVLNFGHTFGHIFEAITKYSHGYSVLWGMEKETQFLYELQMIDKEFYLNLLNIFHSMTKKEFFSLKLDNSYKTYLFSDKKASFNLIEMPVIKDFGNFSIEKISLSEVIDFFKRELIE